MINIKYKKDCCGCNACVQRCPKQCITMHADNEGFLYPVVDTETCIDCGLCKKVCPVINQEEPQEPIKVFAAYNKDEKIREQSSSGGIFTLLAEETIKKGGVVFGVKFNREWMPEFGYTETIEGIAPFRGSKYTQAIVGNAYKHVEDFLKIGRFVLFSGTPCQIAGLKRFLRKEYDTLLTVDIICHGVPSPKVWDMYLKETCSKLLKSTPDEKIQSVSPIGETYKSCIEAVSFRSKITGWKKFSFLLKLNFPTCDGKNTVVFTEPHGKNNFMQLMLAHLSLRPSCHHCKYKEGRSHSDITIADFWGIEKYNHTIDDDKGISAVLVNTKKGYSLFKQINCNKTEQTFKQITTEVTTFQNSMKPHPKRDKFFNNINKYNTEELFLKYTSTNKHDNNIKRIIRFFIKKDFRIIYDTPGQTCNRLWSYLDTVGWAIKNNGKAIILFWDKDIIHFDNLRRNRYVSFPLYSKKLVNFFGNDKYLKLIKIIFANRIMRAIYQRNIYNKFIVGWKKRADNKFFPTAIDTIKELYKPNKEIVNDVEQIVNKYREQGYFIVGVHIRRGDYKTWEDGKYYFEHEEYAKHMDSVVKLFCDKKVCFAISTNEKYDKEVFKHFTICNLHNTTAIHDLYTLCICDCIIGPLSTFSRWASFYGNVPLCFISRDMQISKKEDFSIIRDFYFFENGNEIVNLTDKQ